MTRRKDWPECLAFHLVTSVSKPFSHSLTPFYWPLFQKFTMYLLTRERESPPHAPRLFHFPLVLQWKKCIQLSLLVKILFTLALILVVCPHAHTFPYLTFILPNPLLSSAPQRYSPICLSVSGWQWAKHCPVCFCHNNQPRRLHLMGQKGLEESLLFPSWWG